MAFFIEADCVVGTARARWWLFGKGILVAASLFMLVSCATVSGVKDLSNEYLNIGKEYEGRKEIDKAIEYYRKALALQPGSRMARFNISQLLLVKGDFDNASEYLEALNREDPENQAVQESRAFLLAKKQEYQAAWDLYRSVRVKTDGRPSVLYNLALVGVESDHADEALEVARDLAGLRPQEPRYQRLVVEIAIAADQEDEVDQYLGQYVEMAAGKPDELLSFVDYLEKKGQVERARTVIEGILAKDSKNAKAWFGLAGMQLDKSLVDAAESLSKALESGYDDRDKIRALVALADQAGQEVLLETIRKKIADFSLSPKVQVKKIPGRVRLPGEI